MPKVLVTGMSGTGKSTALRLLGERGHRVVDTDTDQWSHWVGLPDGSADWIWREDAITRLLASDEPGGLFVAGCKTNQGKVLRTVRPRRPAERTPRHPAGQDNDRDNNPYGKRPEERALILQYLAEVERGARACRDE